MRTDTMAKKKPAAPEITSPTADPKWQAENDARDLMRAEEIKSDKKRHEAAIKHLSGQKAAITSIEGLKERAQELAKES